MRRIKLLCLAIVLLESYGATAAKVLAITSIPQISHYIARASGRSLFDEAMQLYRQGTIASLNRAILKFQEAYRLFETEGDRRQQARALNKIGRIYADLGNKQKAIEHLERSLGISQLINDGAGQAYSLRYIGGIYIGLGEHHKAIEYLNRALQLSQAAGDRPLTADTLASLGQAYDSLGQAYDALEQARKAVEYFERALVLSRSVGDRSVEARTLTRLGWKYHTLGQSQRALDYLDRSWRLSRAAGDRSEEARTLLSIGKVYYALRQDRKALEYFNRSLLLIGSVGNRAQKARTLANIAKVLRDRRQLPEALKYIQSAIKIFDNLYSAIGDRDLQTRYFSNIQYYYQIEIDVLMQLHREFPTQGYDRLAFEASERARAPRLLQLLAESNIDLKPKQNSPLVVRERQIQQSLSLLERQRSQLLDGNYSPERDEELNRQSDRLFEQLNNLTTRLRSENPAYTNLKYPQSLTLPQIQQQVLDRHTILLEYSLGQKRSYLWAVTKNELFSYELPKGSKIKAAAEAYRQFLTNHTANDRPQKVIQASIPLSQMLLKPVMSKLGRKRLLVVSEEALQYLPFAALVLPDRTTKASNTKPTNSFLLTEREIVNIPSASTLAALRDQQNKHQLAPKSLAIFADPVFSQNDERLTSYRPSDRAQKTPTNLNTLPASIQTLRSTALLERLPGTRQEAEQILQLIPESQNRRQFFDFDANKVNATQLDLSQYRMVHFATHGIFDRLHPELSKIFLSTVNPQGVYQDGSLNLYDIFNLNLSAELVVLSGCETGLGEDIRGEGLVGLTRGFMYAGTPRVLVSLWSVSDESTAVLMVHFYRAMLEQNLSPAAALRAAQLKMLQNPKWQLPYYWAAFTLQGEWR